MSQRLRLKLVHVSGTCAGRPKNWAPCFGPSLRVLSVLTGKPGKAGAAELSKICSVHATPTWPAWPTWKTVASGQMPSKQLIHEVKHQAHLSAFLIQQLH